MNASFVAQIISMIIIFPFVILVLVSTGQKSFTSSPFVFMAAFIVHSILANAIDKRIKKESSSRALPPNNSPESGNFRVRGSRAKQALQDMSHAISINPNDTNAYYLRGIAHYNGGDLERAVDDFSQAILLNPTIADAYEYRAKVYLKLNLTDLATADEKKAQELTG
jgi:Flp pilus assembly protein TadD